MWQRNWLQDEVLEHQISYWKKQLAGMPNALRLPLDKPRPATQSFRGARFTFTLSEVLTNTIHMIALEESATIFMVLMASFQHLLSRWSGQDDIVVGTPIAGRTDKRTEELIGFFINIIVLRTDLAGDPSLRQLLARVKEITLQAYNHQELPFERLVEELNPIRDLSRQPLVQVMINSILLDDESDFLSKFGLQVEPVFIEDDSARFELMLRFHECENKIICHLDYATDLFEETTIQRFASQYMLLLEKAVIELDRPLTDFSLLTEAEQNLILYEWNNPFSTSDLKCAHNTFFQYATLYPNIIAVHLDNGKSMSYGELAKWSNQIVNYLQIQKIKVGSVVGLIMQESPATLAALLGCLKAGMCILPIDLNYPKEYLREILRENGALLVLGISEETKNLENENYFTFDVVDLYDQDFYSELLYEENISLENVAYLSFIWNESKTKKISMVTHSGLSKFICNKMDKCELKNNKHKFLPFIPSLLLPLCLGDAVLIRQNCFDLDKDFSHGLRTEISNYTETKLLDHPYSIGKKYILDRRLSVVPVGVVGDLYIDASSWSHGYFKRADLTARDFLPSPFNFGQRIYRTGEKAYWHKDGSLKIIDRQQQVVINDYIFDRGEIVSVLKESPVVDQAVVIIREDENKKKNIYAYITCLDDGVNKLDYIAWKSELVKRLPIIMIPEDIILLEKIPLNSDGDIDIDQLLVLSHSKIKYKAPLTKIEIGVAAIWEELLGRDQISLYDNFFDLGGHSLLATLAIARIRELLNIELSLRLLFEAPTLGALSNIIENMLWAQENYTNHHFNNTDGEAGFI